MSVTVDLNGSGAGLNYVVPQSYTEGGDAIRVFGPVTLSGSGRVASVVIEIGGHADGDALSLTARGVLLARSYGLRLEEDEAQPGRWTLTAPSSGTFFSGVAVVLRELQFSSESTTPGIERVFSVTATTTAGATSPVATSTLTVIDLNNPPVLSFGPLDAIDEDGSVALSSLSLADLDGDALRLVITSDQGGAFSLDPASVSDGLTVVVGDGQITIESTAGGVALLEAAARAVVFAPAQDFNGVVQLTARLEEVALLGDPVEVQLSLTVNAVNDAPVLLVDSFPATIAEGGAAFSISVAQLLGASTSDVDGDPVGIAIASAEAFGKGAWFVDGLALPALLPGQALLVAADAVLSFVPADGDVNTFDGNLPGLVVLGWDGTDGSAGEVLELPAETGGTTAFSATRSNVALTITPDNDAPTVTIAVGSVVGVELPPGIGAEGDPLVVIQNILADAELSLTDVESATIVDSDSVSSAFFTRIDVLLSAPGGVVAAGERLFLVEDLDDDNWIIAFDRVSVQWDAHTSTLSLTPVAPEENLPAFVFEAALRTLAYESASNDPTQKGEAPTRTVTVRATDAALEGEAVTREAVATFSIEFEAFDNAPVLQVPEALAINLNDADGIVLGLSVADPDSPAADVSVVVSGPILGSQVFSVPAGIDGLAVTDIQGQDSVGADVVVGVRLAGPQAAVNAALAALELTPVATFATLGNGIFTLPVTVTVTAADADPIEGDDDSVAESFQLTITPRVGSVVVSGPGSIEEDSEGQPFTLADAGDGLITHIAVSGVVGGTLSVGAVGGAPVAEGDILPFTQLLYFTPDPDFNGDAGFTVTPRVSDAADGPIGAAVVQAISVTPVNDAPTLVVQDALVTAEDTVLAVSVVVGDVDDGAELTVTLSSANGTLSVESVTGTVAEVNAALAGLTFTPGADFNDSRGEASITVTVSDGIADPVTVTQPISVTAVNDAPVAGAVSSTVDEDGSVVIAVLDAVTDIDDADGESTETRTVSAVTQPETGSVTVRADGTVLFDAAGSFENLAAGASREVTFDYTVADSAGATSTATVTVTVTGVNDAPTLVVQDALVTAEDTVLAVSVVVGDVDDGAELTVTLSSANGTLSVESVTGTVAEVNAALAGLTFTPGADFNDSRGEASITVTVSDGIADPVTVTQPISVTAVNDAPVILGAPVPAEFVEATLTAANAVEEKQVPFSLLFEGLAVDDVDLLDTAAGSVNGFRIEAGISAGVGDAGDTLVVRDNGTSSRGDVTITQNTASVTFTAAAAVSGALLYTVTAASGALSDQLGAVASFLGSVAFSNAAADPIAGERTVTLTVSDGVDTASVSNTVTVAPVNDAPVLTGPFQAGAGAPLFTREDEFDLNQDAITVAELWTRLDAEGGASLTDLDDGVFGVAIVSVSNVGGTFRYKLPDGEWTAVPANVSASNALVLGPDAMVAFEPATVANANSDNSLFGSMSVKAWDGKGGFASGTTGVNTTAAPNVTAWPFSDGVLSTTAYVEPVDDLLSFRDNGAGGIFGVHTLKPIVDRGALDGVDVLFNGALFDFGTGDMFTFDTNLFADFTVSEDNFVAWTSRGSASGSGTTYVNVVSVATNSTASIASQVDAFNAFIIGWAEETPLVTFFLNARTGAAGLVFDPDRANNSGTVVLAEFQGITEADLTRINNNGTTNSVSFQDYLSG